LPVAITPASTYTNCNTSTATVDINTLHRHKEDDSCEQGTPVTMAASGCDGQSKLSLRSPQITSVTEQKGAGVSDEDLLLGLCPEDLMSCSTSFSTSMNDSTSAGHAKAETFPAEVKTPSIQSPNYPHTNNIVVSLHSTPVHSTPKSNTCKQSSVDIPTDGHESAIDSDFPILASRNEFSVPPDTFYGLPLKVKQCLEEHRGITKLYGNTFNITVVVQINITSLQSGKILVFACRR
jgi:hypothetical protein